MLTTATRQRHEEEAGLSTPTLVGGQLPFGRWATTIPEIDAAYVPADPNDVRRQIWDQWVSLTIALKSVVGEIASCWLSGSFFTDKAIPGDIDCLYIIDTDRLAAVTASQRPDHIWFVQQATKGLIKANYGIPVDSYVLEWVPTSGPNIPVGARSYLELRGYWDDLWVRVKDSNHRLDSVPRRGYLEVIIDGYR